MRPTTDVSSIMSFLDLNDEPSQARPRATNPQLEISTMQTRGLTPSEIIFSCGVCQASLSTIYSEPDDNRGLRSTPDSNNGSITKLWLTECAHLICGKHLDGGENATPGVPFWGEGNLPRSPCPICKREKGDSTERVLFFVQGLRDGQFDPHIPASYFQLPPVRLDASDPNMDAMRFQYLALIRYSTRILEKLKQAARDEDDLRRMMAVETQTVKKLQGQKGLLQMKVGKLQEEVERWKRWREHEPDTVQSLLRENGELKQMLSSLGYAVPDTDRTWRLARESASLPESLRPRRSDDDIAVEDDEFDEYSSTGKKTSLRQHPTVGSHDLHRQHTGTTSEDLPPQSEAQRSLRRLHQRGQIQSQAEYEELGSSGQKRKASRQLESRDIMPPPPLPQQRRTQQQSHSTNTPIGPFSTPNLRGDISPHRRVIPTQSSSRRSNRDVGGSDVLPRSARDTQSDVKTREVQNSPSGATMYGESSQNTGSFFLQQRPRQERPTGASTTLSSTPIRPSYPSDNGNRADNRSRAFETPRHSTTDRSPRSTQAPTTFQTYAGDGELDSQTLYPGQQQRTQSSHFPFPQMPSTQRLTRPPPPATLTRPININNNSNAPHPGLSANIHTSAPLASAYSTPRQPLGMTSSAGNGAHRESARASSSTNNRYDLGQQATSPYFGTGPRSATQDFGTAASENRGFIVDPRDRVYSSQSSFASGGYPEAGQPMDEDVVAGGSFLRREDYEEGRGGEERGLFSASGRRGVRR